MLAPAVDEQRLTAGPAVTRNAARLSGLASGRTLVFAHGFGCDQSMWRLVAPAFTSRFRVMLFDHVGSGHADSAAYSPAKYSSLAGYAADVSELLEEMALDDVVFVGHSVSAMIGVLAAAQDPARYSGLVLVGPSPRYLDDGDGYLGGFSGRDVEDLLEALDSNYLGWANAMAPVIMGHPDRPELGAELAASFCRLDPAIASGFARATFLADNRADLASVVTPTCIVQCSRDTIAPPAVGDYVHRHIANSRLSVIDTSGHCPNLSAPAETIAAISSFLLTLPPSLPPAPPALTW